ncbi:MAG: ribose-phosphate diphosphokinase [Planctomycetota bacterium]|nr:ribose-phosphate diphosphokinase [Planctomycetota bacterium]
MTIAETDRPSPWICTPSPVRGFFDIPCDHLMAAIELVKVLRNLDTKNMAIASPDIGSIKIAVEFGNRLDVPLVVIDKRRVDDTKVEMPHIIGEVKDKSVLLVDDMVATGGTLVKAAEAMKNNGATEVICALTHPVLAGDAVSKIKNSMIDKLYVTDTIPLGDKKKQLDGMVEVVTVAPLLAEAIRRIHRNESVSWLFRNNL